MIIFPLIYKKIKQFKIPLIPIKIMAIKITRTILLYSIIFYIGLNSIVYIQERYYTNELEKFDLNNDGFFSKNEINKEQKKLN